MDRIPLNLGYMWFYDSEKELLSVLLDCMVQPPLIYGSLRLILRLYEIRCCRHICKVFKFIVLLFLS